MTTTQIPELYWLPGCTACMRMKEFATAGGVEFRAINLEDVPERAAEFHRTGLLAPVACVGDRCVNGLDLSAVADLLGLPYEAPEILSPGELHARSDLLVGVLLVYLNQAPAELLEQYLPGRDRPVLEVVNQTTCVMRAFLSAYYDDVHDVSQYDRPDHVRTTEDLAVRARETRRLLDEWWERDGFDDRLDRVLVTYWGHHTLHEVLEREVWHTAQHLRQIEYVLTSMGIEPEIALTEQHLGGLPLPQSVHA
jgi:hypothetical protein